MDDVTASFVDGIGAAAATSGILSQQQGRIFALLYLSPEPLSLDSIALALEQSKSNISVNIRTLVSWHLVRLRRIPGSRKDHYEAVTDLWRVMQEIMERRFRWNLRQVIAAADEADRAAAERDPGRRSAESKLVAQRLDAIRAFFRAVDAGIQAVSQGKSFAADTVKGALRLVGPRSKRTR